MKLAAQATIIGLLLAGVLFLLQLWFKVFDAVWLVKIYVTIGIIVGIIDVSALVRAEYLKEKDQKKDGYID